MSNDSAQKFDVVLQSYVIEEKIRVIAAVSQLTGLGMSDAKDLVASAPVVVKAGLSREAAGKVKEDLEAGYWPGMRNFERLPPGERCCAVEVRQSQDSIQNPS